MGFMVKNNLFMSLGEDGEDFTQWNLVQFDEHRGRHLCTRVYRARRTPVQLNPGQMEICNHLYRGSVGTEGSRISSF